MNCVSEINDTHMEELGLYWIQYKKSLKYKLDASDAALHNQLSFLIPLLYRCLKNVIHQIDSENEWLLLSVTFMAKIKLVFVLIFAHAFS